jgi:hypothetical protein
VGNLALFAVHMRLGKGASDRYPGLGWGWRPWPRSGAGV